MERANYLISEIADIDNLRLAFWKASKGKRHKQKVLGYQKDIEKNLLNLQNQILTGNIEVGHYTCFDIYEPKRREICASAFSEQILHHALMNICHPFFDKVQIFDSYASRKNKGTHKAIERAKGYSKKYPYFLKLDVRKFFNSIEHSVLKAQISRLFKEKDLLYIFAQIIDSYQKSDNRSLPIGNLTSQYFANHYLAGLDHFAKEKLSCKAYIRYMDDTLIFGETKAVLLEKFGQIETYTRQILHLELKPKILEETAKGLPFLGYMLYPTHIQLLQKSKIRFIRKYQKIQKHKDAGIWTEAKCQRKLLPLLAFVGQADTYFFKKKILSV